MSVRRIVSGQVDDGLSRIIDDAEVAGVPMVTGVEIVPIWGADAVPSFPLAGSFPGYEKFRPGPNSYRVFQMTIWPTDAAGAEDDIEMLKAAEKIIGTGLVESLPNDVSPGMHATDTVDVIFVLSGTVGMEMDGGDRVVFSAGETFVQNGTCHQWFNPGTEPAVVAVTMIGGQPRG
ncbi:hypothetical protein BH10PSE12_BH10PSE12_23650 [soil metagenome]